MAVSNITHSRLRCLGAFILTLALPEFLYLVNRGCNQRTCIIHNFPPLIPQKADMLDIRAYLLVIGWVLFQVGLACLPIGIHAALISILAFLVLGWLGVPVTVVYDKFMAILLSACVLNFIASINMYIKSRKVSQPALDVQGNTGYCWLDFFVGRELNPRIGSLDLKFFVEMRPGLIGWIMFNLAFLKKSLDNGDVPSIAITLTVLFQIIYVLVLLWNEVSVLSSVSIVHECLGYLYLYRRVLWVPFIYTLPTRFLLEHANHDHLGALTIVFFINILGIVILKVASRPASKSLRARGLDAVFWRSTNLTKMRNRATSSWLGECRNPHQLADIVLSVAWAVLCGASQYITYFFPLYITLCAVVRERRERAILLALYQNKYRDYCMRNPRSIIPSVY